MGLMQLYMIYGHCKRRICSSIYMCPILALLPLVVECCRCG